MKFANLKVSLLGVVLLTVGFHAAAQSMQTRSSDDVVDSASVAASEPARKSTIRETRDEQGRLMKVVTASGVIHNFSYDDLG